MRTTIRRDRIVDLVIGNRRSFAIHFGFVMIADHAALSPAVTSWTVGRTHEADERLILRWTEIGGPAVQPPARQGFGARVVERMIGQLKGKARFDWCPQGLVCEITLQT